MSIEVQSAASAVPPMGSAVAGANGPSGPIAPRWFSDPGTENAAWQQIDRLTTGDRVLIKAATGRDVPTRAAASRP